ncbi:MAG: hypothetical protein LUC92_04770 [Clostridiales bacterium]|nr:hypothetical protein [Clostridiales bacterium]
MKIGVLNKGDSVINVTSDFIAVQRQNGEVDLISLVNDNLGFRVDLENIVTIGYGQNIVEIVDGSGINIKTF